MSAQPLTDGGHHRALVGELTAVELGIDQLAVDGQLETATVRGDQLQAL